MQAVDRFSPAGKSSLKKTLSGESYDVSEKPTMGINADPSVTRVTFKQFKEWAQQPSSKADTQRLNLEYIDVVIDYILYFVRQPQVCVEKGGREGKGREGKERRGIGKERWRREGGKGRGRRRKGKEG